MGLAESYFNPRSPHGERQKRNDLVARGLIFQSTLPARGATQPFQTRPTHQRISIHAPRTGSDVLLYSRQHKPQNFNPRSPHGERQISALTGIVQKDFNPRSPHGERPSRKMQISRLWRFQSTLPARGATLIDSVFPTIASISIHAPRTGSDVRQPCHLRNAPRISIHAPRTGSDADQVVTRTKVAKFQSTLPARGATKNTSGVDIDVQFQSTLPARGATKKNNS